MKRLIKGKQKVENTVEGFACGCSCYCPCYCYCPGSLTRASNTAREDSKKADRDFSTGVGSYN